VVARELFKQIRGEIAQEKIPGIYFDRLRIDELFLGNKAMRPVVSNGIIAVKARAGLIEIISASLPVRGVIIPPVPKAKPIIRLEAIALPFGANSCAIVTPKGRVARMRNPVKKEQKYTQLPGRKSNKNILTVARLLAVKKIGLYPILSDKCPAKSPLIAPPTVKRAKITPIEIKEYPSLAYNTGIKVMND